MDDPLFSRDETRILNLPQVRAVIVTTERAKELYRQSGVLSPIRVIPPVLLMKELDPNRIEEIRTRLRGHRDLVIGYLAPSLTVASDGVREEWGQLNELDLLFRAVDAVHSSRRETRLWLVGNASRGVQELAAERPWVQLVGYVAFPDVLHYVANLDIGVYPRRQIVPPGRFSAKLGQYIACGVPIVSLSVDEARIVDAAKCGMVCCSEEEFTRALMTLAGCEAMRRELSQNARAYWDANLRTDRVVAAYRQVLSD
jgi:glycosyltransferase involved in cell wall biosynthesis